ncbi:unnamed protein product [Discula destructiva]
MAELVEELAAVTPTGVPWRIKSAELFKPHNLDMLYAIMRAIVPPVVRESKIRGRRKLGTVYISDEEFHKIVAQLKKNTVVFDSASEEDLEVYLAESPSDSVVFRQTLQGMLIDLPPETKGLLVSVLSTLSVPGIRFALTGKLSTIQQLSIEQRQKVLQFWLGSRIPQLRGLFRQMTSLAKVAFTATSETFQKLSGFPVTPLGWKPPPTFQYDFIQLPAAHPQLLPPTSNKAHAQAQAPPPVELETDVVIVGSGCGAGVCAKNLAEAGWRVLVLDKGYHFDSAFLPMASQEHLLHMIDGAGAITSDDNSILVVAGSCFGGGGTVNWSASLRTQGFVRDEWADERGLTFFKTGDFDESLNYVCEQMGVHTDFTPNHGNQILLDGAEKLGWSAKKVPQNTGRSEHHDGYCAMGCSTGDKKGPVHGWFPDAARAGAKFMEGAKVRRVLFDKKKRSKAVGVEGTWTSRGRSGELDGREEDKIVRRFRVKANKVILSSGTLWSPVLLKASGLKNPNIGKNLYLHPVNVMTGVFPQDIRPWEGGILTTVVNTFENLDGKGHGAKLECLSMMPCYAMQFMNWSPSFKTDALKYRHMNSYISIVRDRDPGSIYPDKNTGQPRLCYTPSAFDRRHAMIGNVALAEILYMQGAAEIHAALPGMPPFIRETATTPSTSFSPTTSTPTEDIVNHIKNAGIKDAKFVAWIEQLKRHGNRTPESPFTSAHQMGTCRMSTSARTGVVDPRGRVWGTEDLYVADASVFPSASGVNPMVTNMAISNWTSRGVVRDLAAALGQARL